MKTVISLVLALLPYISTAQTTITIKLLAEKMTSPTAMAHSGDGTDRVFVCEQHGIVRVMRKDVMNEVPFLDIREKVIPQTNVYTERGLIGIAFHPQYKTNRKFYVYYSAPHPKKEFDNKGIVAEYRTSATNADLADPKSERIILEIDDPESNHNGGQLLFGPDGFLYIGLGDGGGLGDEHGQLGNGQNLETLLGKILRIDVNTPRGKNHKQAGYRIPRDNPFVGKPGRDEIWAYGFRNPWQFSFDKKTKLLFGVDVGQDKWEEVNIIKKGKNYGWRIMEGNHCYYKDDCEKVGLELPIAEYGHEEGQAITGGYVYNGSYLPMRGKYFFSDLSGKIFVLSQNPDKTWKREEINWAKPEGKISINSMGANEQGELYLLMQTGLGPEVSTGMIYKIGF